VERQRSLYIARDPQVPIVDGIKTPAHDPKVSISGGYAHHPEQHIFGW
jgi:hypothetical protein